MSQKFSYRFMQTRREMLILTGSTLSSLVVAGCGGGAGSGVGATFTTSSPAPNQRAVPSGDLMTQVTQYSKTVEDFSFTWKNMPATFNAFSDFVRINRSSGRAIGDFNTLSANLKVILPGMISGYERALDAFLGLDNLGAFGESVTTNYKLKGAASLANPQWTAAMMEFHAQLISAMGGTIQSLLKLGREDVIATVHERTDPDSKLIAYYMAALMHNEWVDQNSAALKIAPDPSWKMDISSQITAANADQAIDQMIVLMNKVPLGPGYRTLPSRATGALDSNAQFAWFRSFVNAAAKIAVNLENPANLPPTTLKALGDILKGRGPGLSTLESIAVNISVAIWEKTGQKKTACVTKTAIDFFNTAALLDAAIGTSSVGGGIIFGGLTVYSICDFNNDLKECLKIFQVTVDPQIDKLLKALQDLCDKLPKFPEIKEIPAVPITKGLEHDQISSGSVTLKTVKPIKKTTPDEHRSLVCGAVSGGASSGRAAQASIRTFDNIDLATNSLIYDLAKRNPISVLYKDGDDFVEIFASNIAFLARRAQSNSIAIPAITDADLFCTAPGFIPERSARPMDLSQTTLPALKPITGISPGVNFNVK